MLFLTHAPASRRRLSFFCGGLGDARAARIAARFIRFPANLRTAHEQVKPELFTRLDSQIIILWLSSNCLSRSAEVRLQPAPSPPRSKTGSRRHNVSTILQ